MRTKSTYPVNRDVTESHGCTLEVEKIDYFHCTALLQSFKIQAFWFVIHLDEDRLYFNVF
jgi:hypothetical protein